MATDRLELETAFSKLIEQNGGDLLRNALTTLLNEMMRREVEQRCGAGYHERSDNRETSRNGYRERTLSTRLGDIDSEIQAALRLLFSMIIEPQEALGESLCQRHLRGVSAWRLDSKGGEADGVDGRDRGEPQRGL